MSPAFHYAVKVYHNTTVFMTIALPVTFCLSEIKYSSHNARTYFRWNINDIYPSYWAASAPPNLLFITSLVFLYTQINYDVAPPLGPWFHDYPLLRDFGGRLYNECIKQFIIQTPYPHLTYNLAQYLVRFSLCHNHFITVYGFMHLPWNP